MICDGNPLITQIWAIGMGINIMFVDMLLGICMLVDMVTWIWVVIVLVLGFYV